jgi:hypothetical protein
MAEKLGQNAGREVLDPLSDDPDTEESWSPL